MEIMFDSPCTALILFGFFMVRYSAVKIYDLARGLGQTRQILHPEVTPTSNERKRELVTGEGGDSTGK